MSFIKEENIGKISFIGSTILVVLLATILATISLRDQRRHFQENIQQIEIDYPKYQQERLKSEVEMQISAINAWRNSSEQNLMNNIKARVYEAHAVAENLYRQNRGKSSEEIQSRIREALRPIRFNNGRGYFFIFFISRTQGPLVLYPPYPDAEVPNTKAPNHLTRTELMQKMAATVQTSGEGFINYQWPKPGGMETELIEKISFVKYFEPFDWVIGTGEYLDNVEKQEQHVIVENLNRITPDSDSPEYVFIYQLHDMDGGDEFATMLVNPNRPDLIGKIIPDSYTDIKGKMFRKEMLQGIRDKGEAFVTYSYKQPGSGINGTKLTYFKYYPEWKWIVAKGTYLAEMNQRIAQLQDDLQKKKKNTIRYYVSFVILTCIIFLIIGYFFSKGIYRLFAGYKATQKEQQDELERVNAALRIQAAIDPLTHLYNRGYFNTHLEIEITRSERHGSTLSLIILDIDKFKHINDTFGHLSGDDILKDLSQLCQTNIRSIDILARWGGEEFVVLMPENDEKGATTFSERMRKLIEKHPFSIAQKVTCSFGVTQYRKGDNRDTFINRTDEALYAAKAGGRNLVVSI